MTGALGVPSMANEWGSEQGAVRLSDLCKGWCAVLRGRPARRTWTETIRGQAFARVLAHSQAPQMKWSARCSAPVPRPGDVLWSDCET